MAKQSGGDVPGINACQWALTAIEKRLTTAIRIRFGPLPTPDRPHPILTVLRAATRLADHTPLTTNQRKTVEKIFRAAATQDMGLLLHVFNENLEDLALPSNVLGPVRDYLELEAARAAIGDVFHEAGTDNVHLITKEVTEKGQPKFVVRTFIIDENNRLAANFLMPSDEPPGIQSRSEDLDAHELAVRFSDVRMKSLGHIENPLLAQTLEFQSNIRRLRAGNHLIKTYAAPSVGQLQTAADQHWLGEILRFRNGQLMIIGPRNKIRNTAVCRIFDARDHGGVIIATRAIQKTTRAIQRKQERHTRLDERRVPLEVLAAAHDTGAAEQIFRLSPDIQEPHKIMGFRLVGTAPNQRIEGITQLDRDRQDPDEGPENGGGGIRPSGPTPPSGSGSGTSLPRRSRRPSPRSEVLIVREPVDPSSDAPPSDTTDRLEEKGRPHVRRKQRRSRQAPKTPFDERNELPEEPTSTRRGHRRRQRSTKTATTPLPPPMEQTASTLNPTVAPSERDASIDAPSAYLATKRANIPFVSNDFCSPF